MLVTIAEVHENKFQGEALSLTVPTTGGELTVLPKHEPLVTTLREGTITVRTEGGVQTFVSRGGVLEISQNQATVLL